MNVYIFANVRRQAVESTYHEALDVPPGIPQSWRSRRQTTEERTVELKVTVIAESYDAALQKAHAMLYNPYLDYSLELIEAVDGDIALPQSRRRTRRSVQTAIDSSTVDPVPETATEEAIDLTEIPL